METQVARGKFSSINVIASLLVFMPGEFNNDPQIIHSTIARLKQDARYRDLLEEFDFLEYEPYPYSPLLGRTLNRLQESRLLSSLNPSYEKYVVTEESKEAIRGQILNVKLADQTEKLREIASELKKALS
jgi:hypothetical protein